MELLQARFPYPDWRAMTRSPSPRAWRTDFPGFAREPACRGTFGGGRKAVRDRFALQGGTGDFP